MVDVIVFKRTVSVLYYFGNFAGGGGCGAGVAVTFFSSLELNACSFVNSFYFLINIFNVIGFPLITQTLGVSHNFDSSGLIITYQSKLFHPL